MFTRSRLLVPLDGSPLAERALQCAESVASLGAEVILLRVVEASAGLVGAARGPAPDGTAASAPRRAMEEAQGEAARYLERVKAGLARPDLVIRAEVVEGDPAERIIELAAQRSAVVIVSARGRGESARFPLGRVAERVVRDAPGPVLLVR